MMQPVFDSRDLPITERFEVWRHLTGETLAPNEISIDDTEGFQGSLRAVELGSMQVAALTYSSLRSKRTPKLIRRSDPAGYAVALVLSGRQIVVQNRREASPAAPGLVVYSDSSPYEAIVDASGGLAATVLTRIPRSALPIPAARVDRLLAVPMAARGGVGGLLSGFLTHLATDTGSYRPADNLRLGTVLRDLVTTWLAHHAEAEERVPVETRERVQFLQIRSFLLRHLGDPDLSPSAVAAAHHMSLRSLYRLFARHGVTVAAFIRRQRLAAARRDLCDPNLAARPVWAIATSWGFSRPADFTRAFRAEYGTAPSEYRYSMLYAKSGIHR